MSMGKVMEISSLNNPRVKGLAALAMKKHRTETGLFVAEGLQLVGFGVESGWELDTLIRCKVEGTRYKEEGALWERLAAAAASVLEVTPTVMEKLARKENPQAVLGVFRQRRLRLEHFAQLLEDFSALPTARESSQGKRAGTWVVLEEVRDPGNLGTIIRTVDAVGAQGVLLVGDCADLYSPECIRATMGSIFHVPVAKCKLPEFLAWRKSFGGMLIGTHLRAAVDYRQVEVRKPLLLAMGSEQKGLSDALADVCDVRVKIPMRGKAESLNVAVAAGVALYGLTVDG